MNQKIFSYGKDGKNKLIVDKDFFVTIFGIILVVLCAFLSAVLQLIQFGFDFTLVKSADFWISYLVKLIIGYLCLFGCYFIRRSRNLKKKKFIAQRQNINNYRKAIVRENKVICFKEDFLKNIYNFKRKVERYQEKLLSKLENLNLSEPEPVDERKYENTKSDRKRLNRANKTYLKLKKRYDDEVKLNNYIKEQLEVCIKLLKYVELLRNHKEEEAKVIISSIKKNDIDNFKIKIEEATYTNIFNFDMPDNRIENSLYYKESKFTSKNTIPFSILMLVLIVIISSLEPLRKGVTWETFILIGLNLLVVGWNAFSGTMLADRFVWGVAYNIDSNKLAILEEFKEYSKLVVDKVEVEDMEEVKMEKFKTETEKDKIEKFNTDAKKEGE